MAGVCVVVGACGGGGCMAERAWERGRAWQKEHGRGGVHAGETATDAGGTHPTGMYSCYRLQ